MLLMDTFDPFCIPFSRLEMILCIILQSRVLAIKYLFGLKLQARSISGTEMTITRTGGDHTIAHAVTEDSVCLC